SAPPAPPVAPAIAPAPPRETAAGAARAPGAVERAEPGGAPPEAPRGSSAPPVDASADQLAFDTALAGAAFLIGRALELDLGEHLWCAGVDEALAITAAIARLVPPEHARDPILPALAGRSGADLPDLPEVARWAADEVTGKATASLGRWLARRGRLLQPAELAGEVDALAAALGGPADLTAVLAAALAAAACARLEVAWHPAAAGALVVRAGRVRVGDEEIRVELPGSSIDVEIRRAGLDLDPGWVPWLSRRVRIAYTGRGEDA